MKPAGFWIRFAGLVIDFWVIQLGLFFLIMVLNPIAPFLPVEGTPMHNVATIVAFFVVLSIPTVYGAVLEASRFRGTVGKLVLGIEVLDADGGPLSIRRAIIRNVIKLVCVFVPPLQALILFQVLSSDRRSLHDRAARSIVVRGSEGSNFLKLQIKAVLSWVRERRKR